MFFWAMCQRMLNKKWYLHLEYQCEVLYNTVQYQIVMGVEPTLIYN